MQAVGQFYAQQLYFPVNQAIFGRSIAFGHNCLIRREAFQKIELPSGILSHDTWETALLEQQGYKTVFLTDLVSYEEAAPHYLEERRRSKRWLRGTLQGWPLLFLPRISFSTRFLLFYQIYLYLVPAILCFWIISTLLARDLLSPSLFTSRPTSLLLFAFTFGTLFFHRMTAARTPSDIKRIIQETFFSTLVGLQNVLYGTLDFLVLPFEKLGWIPMTKNPSVRLGILECVQRLVLGTGFGCIFLWLGLDHSIAWTVFTLPVLASLILSIPSVYLSSKNFVRARLLTGV